MIKYMIYRLFLSANDTERNIFISGNSKKTMEIIEALSLYKLKGVHYNWQDRCGYNIVLYYSKGITLQRCVKDENTLYVCFGEGHNIYDLIYIILSAYYMAGGKMYGSNSNILCL